MEAYKPFIDACINAAAEGVKVFTPDTNLDDKLVEAIRVIVEKLVYERIKVALARVGGDQTKLNLDPLLIFEIVKLLIQLFGKK